MKIFAESSDHLVHASASVAVSAAVWPWLTQATQIAAFCSYVLSAIACLISIALGTPKVIRKVREWWLGRKFSGSDNESGL